MGTWMCNGVVRVRGLTGKEAQGTCEENPWKVWLGSEVCRQSMAVLKLSPDILLGTRKEGRVEVCWGTGVEVGCQSQSQV